MTQSALKDDLNNIETALTQQRELVVGERSPIRISAGHRIQHHDGKCSRPHGHNYEITVKITGQLTEEGWVVDKGHVTNVIDNWDHRFLLEDGDPLIDALRSSGDDDAIVILNHPPTAEVMSIVLERRLKQELPDTVSDICVQIRETNELSAGASL